MALHPTAAGGLRLEGPYGLADARVLDDVAQLARRLLQPSPRLGLGPSDRPRCRDHAAVRLELREALLQDGARTVTPDGADEVHGHVVRGLERGAERIRTTRRQPGHSPGASPGCQH